MEDAMRMQVQECRPESVNSIQNAQTMIPVHRLQHSSILQTATDTRIRLHGTATIVEHQTGQESTLRYARLKTLHVANVARRGTLIHYAEAVGHLYTC